MNKEDFFSLKDSFSEEFDDINLSDRNESYYIYINIPHDKKINKTVNIRYNIDLYSIISFGINQLDIISEKEQIPIHYNYSFCWKNDQTNSYPITLPQKTKTIYCPKRNWDNMLCYWDKNKKKAIDSNGKEIEIINIIKKKIKKSQRPLKFVKGFPIRVIRAIIWKMLYPLLILFIQINKIIHKIITGKRIIIKRDDNILLFISMEYSKLELTVIEEDAQKIDFFGLNINLIPLLLYCSIHFGLYLLFYFKLGINEFIKQIFTNTFLTVIYVILSLSIMELVIGKIIFLLTQLETNIVKIIRNKMIPKNGMKEIKI